VLHDRVEGGHPPDGDGLADDGRPVAEPGRGATVTGEAGENVPTAAFPARAGPPGAGGLAAELVERAGRVRGDLDRHGEAAVRARDLLAGAGARARTAADAVEALLAAVSTSETLVATMARLAQQTGRVALNASSEVAREFAVVADAMRRLAVEGGAAAQGAARAAAEARSQVERALGGAQGAAGEVDAAHTYVRALASALADVAADAVAVEELAAAMAARAARRGASGS
jgi:methyl-accepting chemotaxis protein